MNQSFYAAAVAASQQQQSLNVVSNNIANINTIAFKTEQHNFLSFYIEHIKVQKMRFFVEAAAA